MWYYLYNNASGELVSESSLPINPIPVGLAVASFDDRQTGKIWNHIDHTFSVAPPVKPQIISNSELLQRMTPTERISIRLLAKTDVIADDFMQLLNYSINVHLDNPNVAMGLGYLASKGVLTVERAAIIGDH